MKTAMEHHDVRLSLYVNGRYCESDVREMPFVKESEIMLSLRQVCNGLGLSVEHNAELGFFLIYARSPFDADVLTVRYLRDAEGADRLCYYMQRGEVIELPAIEWDGGEIFVPMELFARAFGCNCTASDCGNINVRRDEAFKPAVLKSIVA